VEDFNPFGIEVGTQTGFNGEAQITATAGRARQAVCMTQRDWNAGMLMGNPTVFCNSTGPAIDSTLVQLAQHLEKLENQYRAAKNRTHAVRSSGSSLDLNTTELRATTLPMLQHRTYTWLARAFAHTLVFVAGQTIMILADIHVTLPAPC